MSAGEKVFVRVEEDVATWMNRCKVTAFDYLPEDGAMHMIER